MVHWANISRHLSLPPISPNIHSSDLQVLTRAHVSAGMRAAFKALPLSSASAQNPTFAKLWSTEVWGLMVVSQVPIVFSPPHSHCLCSPHREPCIQRVLQTPFLPLCQAIALFQWARSCPYLSPLVLLWRVVQLHSTEFIKPKLNAQN